MEEVKPIKSEETSNSKNLPEISDQSSASSDSSDISSDEELETVIMPPSQAPSQDDSLLIIDAIAQRKDTFYLSSLTNSLREIPLFPIFGDLRLAKISVNYFLYLEFFHGIIRIFGYTFLFYVLTFPLSWIIPKIVPDEYAAEAKIDIEIFIIMISLIMLRILPRRELKRIVEEKVLYESQWSEDMFSVLVEGLPLDVTKEEISYYFKSLLSQEYDSSRLVDIIYLHDYVKYVPIKKKLEKARKKLKKQNEKGIDSKKTEKLTKEIDKLETQLNQMNQEISQMKHFRGKVIVIFESIASQNEIVQLFRYGRIKSLLISCFKSCYKQYYLRNNRIAVKTLPEPRDLQFENLHYSKCTKRTRATIGWITSFVLIQLGLFVFGQVQFQKAKENPKLMKYLLPIGTFILFAVLEKGHKLFQKFYVHKSALDSKLDALNYYNRISTWTYLSSQMVFSTLSPENFTSSLLWLMLVYGIKTILGKAFQIYSTNKSLQKISEKNSDTLVGGLLKKVRKKYIEFDFIKGISRALPPLYIGAAFLVTNPLALLPILIGVLYITAILDKYKIIKTCDLFSAKSAYYMLKPFWIYNWIPVVGVASGIMRIRLMYPGLYQIKLLISWIGIGGVILLASTAFFARPLRKTVKERFVEMNGSVLYESVSDSFSSSFRKKDPYHQNKFTTASCNA